MKNQFYDSQFCDSSLEIICFK